MTKVTFAISGMHCTSCAMSIDGDLEDTKGVTEANTNYAKAVTVVTFDDNQVSIEDLCRQIKKTGYSAVLTKK